MTCPGDWVFLGQVIAVGVTAVALSKDLIVGILSKAVSMVRALK